MVGALSVIGCLDTASTTEMSPSYQADTAVHNDREQDSPPSADTTRREADLGPASFTLTRDDAPEAPLITVDESRTPNDRLEASIYGGVLSISVQDGDYGVQVLVRLDALRLPASVSPSLPGSAGWISMISGEEDIYSTQAPSGVITVDSCPQGAGDRIVGSINAVTLAHLTEMSNLAVSGSFDLPLESVDFIPTCDGPDDGTAVDEGR